MPVRETGLRDQGADWALLIEATDPADVLPLREAPGPIVPAGGAIFALYAFQYGVGTAPPAQGGL